METWKPVVGYEGFYEVSDLGRVRSVSRIAHIKRGNGEYDYRVKGKIVEPQERRHGYLAVCLYGKESKNGRFTQKSVHRLVAEAFLPNPNGYSEVNHKDENKQNNVLENLEWCSHLHNTHYGTAIQRRVAKQRNGKKAKAVDQLDMNGNYIRTFPSMAEAKRQMGYEQSAICYAIKGKYSHAYGYKWRYAI